MKVRDVMTSPVWTCEPTDTLNEIARIMWDEDVGTLVVTDSTRHVVGLITDRDVAMAAYLRGQALSQIGVFDTMTRTVRACGPDDTVTFAQRVMARHQVRRLPVIDDDGRLVGLLSVTDLIRTWNLGVSEIEAQELARTLGAVGRGRPAA